MADTILIVEDELAIADSIAYALRTDGFVARHVSLGSLALAAMREPDGALPALIVLDVGLPDMNGFEVCRQLRQFCDVPVIFLTARCDEIDRIVGLEIGADDYVTKPFSPRELVARIRVVLRRLAPRATTANDTVARNVAPSAARPDREIGEPPAIGLADARIQPRFEQRPHEARIVFCGHPLELTRYEYLLLKTLLDRPGHVLSRAQLMDLVWTDAHDTLDRTVDAHVKSLRAKLKLCDPAADPIHTHRGMGYSIDPA
jgi:two-component system catabolic regulation response regulator CreB